MKIVFGKHKKVAVKWMVIAHFLIPGMVGPALGQQLSKTCADSLPLNEIKGQDWQILMEEIMENSDEEISVELIQDLLSDLAENPISLNTATKEALESVPFLTESQVEGLSYYLYRYGPLVSLSELLLVEGMDEQTLRWLEPFVILGKPEPFPVEMPSLKKALVYGKQEIRIRTGRYLQEKLGYLNASDSSQAGNAYVGDPNQLNFRYGFNYKNKMQWGLILEKDAGEKIWNKPGKGIDYLSFHFVIKDQKKVKTLILGDYSLRFGQGLVCASSFSLGKNTSGTALEQAGANLSRHFSSSESGFFRGIGATFVLKPFVQKTTETKGNFGIEITGFGSSKKMDAKMENGSFSTISTSELHRTPSEAALNDNINLWTFGAHCAVRTGKGQFGITALSYRFNAIFNPEWKPYNCFYFRGKQGGNLSIDYRLLYKGILVFGEMAIDEKRNPALLTGFVFKPYSRLDLSFLGRSYAPEYNAYFGNAFSEGPSVQNEYGFFATGEWRFIREWRLNAYYDVFTFPWLKYGINTPSSGYEYAIQATYKPSSGSQLVLRFKIKNKDRNEDNDQSTFLVMENNLKKQIRLQVSFMEGPWTLKTVLDGNAIPIAGNKRENVGFAASQEITYSPLNKVLSFSLRYALFDTDDFDNRIYSYEKDLPGAFSMPSFYGKGNRFSLLFNYEFTGALSFWAKIGHSIYLDRNKVGTNLEQVQENYLTDFRGMIRWKF